MPPPRPAPTVPDEDFFSLIQKVQSSRLEEQRTTLPTLIPESTGKKKKKQPSSVCVRMFVIMYPMLIYKYLTVSEIVF